MAIVKRFHWIIGNKTTDTPEETTVDDPNALQVRCDDKEAGHAPFNETSSTEEAKPSQDAQAGVQKIEAVTLAWPKGTAFGVLVLYVSCPAASPSFKRLAR